MFINSLRNRADIERTGRIILKPTSTLCVVEDARGRQFNAESDGTYNVGQTVLIKDGILIGKTKRSKKVSHFNV